MPEMLTTHCETLISKCMGIMLERLCHRLLSTVIHVLLRSYILGMYVCIALSLSLSLSAVPSALVDITEDTPPEPQGGETLTLVSMDTEQPSSDKKKQKQSKKKKRSSEKGGGKEKEEEEEVVVVEEGGGGGGDLDDLEFWLSKGDAPVQKKKKVCRSVCKRYDTREVDTFCACYM